MKQMLISVIYHLCDIKNSFDPLYVQGNIHWRFRLGTGAVRLPTAKKDSFAFKIC